MSDDDIKTQADVGSLEDTSDGIFIIENMQVSIPAGGLKFQIGDKGNIEVPRLKIELLIDMSIYWLKISLEHLKAAHISNNNLKLALQGSDEEILKTALEAEFSASMQVLTSMAFALDAFHKMIRERIEIPKNVTEAWKAKGTNWETQVTEVLKHGFTIKHEPAKKLAILMKAVAVYRNEAVHPPIEAKEAIYHPEIRRKTEWRFVRYTFPVAKTGFEAILNLMAQLLLVHKKKFKPLGSYMETFEKALQPIVNDWESKYGPLPYKQVSKE